MSLILFPNKFDRCISESSTTKAAVILAELAIARGSKENINVIVIDLKSSTTVS